ncbi:MAG: zinc ribbon domain-containing protein [Chloroflexi bacterium]|nr:zinc ribbon domain-containing protein [Chloroflexota bacterium]
MIVCPSCQTQNADDAQSCQSCDEPLLFRACPSCGATNPVGNRFCRRCFAELVVSQEEGPPSEEVAERTADKGAPESPGPSVLFIAEDLGTPEEPHESPPADRYRDEGAGWGRPEPLHLAPPDDVQDEPEPEQPEAEEQAALSTELVADPLEGLGEVIPLEAAVSLPHRAAPHAAERADDAELGEARLFWEIAEAPAPLREAVQVVAPSARGGMPALARVALNLLVLLAALAAVLNVELRTSGRQAAAPARQAVANVAELLDGLPQDAVVLLSFDYSPAYSGEIDLLATSVVQHLAARSVRTVAMSTQATGIGIAARVFNQVADGRPGWRYGEAYALLGYLPDREAGLRTLSRSLDAAFKTDHVQSRSLGELPITQGLATLGDIDQVIVFADDVHSVRLWIEQVESQSAINLHGLVTTRIEPQLIPYLQSGQLKTLLGAAYAGPEYASWLAAHSEAEQVRLAPLAGSGGWGSYSVPFLILLAVAVVTNLVYLSQGRADRRPG